MPYFVRSLTAQRGLLVVACGLALLFMACGENLDTVGTDIGDDLFVGGAPTDSTLSPTVFEIASDPVATEGQTRILIGQTNDPIAGEIAATGDIAFGYPAEVSEGFEDATITGAELELSWDYVYGDTLETVQLELAQIMADDAWEMDDRTAADPASGQTDPISTVTLSPSDSSDTISLDEWVLEGLDDPEVLQDSTRFTDEFHGFQLKSDGGNAVLGLEAVGSPGAVGPGVTTLRVTAEDDEGTEFEEAFSINETFSGLESVSEGTPPDNHLLIQDGIGKALSFTFDLPEEFSEAPVNRAVIVLPGNQELLEEPDQENFVRSLPGAFELDLFLEDREEVITFSELVFDEETRSVRLTGTASVQGPPELINQVFPPRQLFQSISLGELEIDRFRLRPVSPDPQTGAPTLTINPFLLRDSTEGDEDLEQLPRLEITVSGTE